jgi:hypothetical protein
VKPLSKADAGEPEALQREAGSPQTAKRSRPGSAASIVQSQKQRRLTSAQEDRIAGVPPAVASASCLAATEILDEPVSEDSLDDLQ